MQKPTSPKHCTNFSILTACRVECINLSPNRSKSHFGILGSKVLMEINLPSRVVIIIILLRYWNHCSLQLHTGVPRVEQLQRRSRGCQCHPLIVSLQIRTHVQGMYLVIREYFKEYLYYTT